MQTATSTLEILPLIRRELTNSQSVKLYPAEGDKIPGVAYNAETVTIIVNVTDNDDGTLTSGAGRRITGINIYEYLCNNAGCNIYAIRSEGGKGA